MSQSILRIDASARHQDSVTRKLTARIAEIIGGEVTHLDLADQAPGLLTEQMIGSYFTPADQRTDDQRAAIAESDARVAELQEADTIVIGMPIYNFGVPGALKAWADLVARSGVTFRYTEEGPKGLLEGKRAIIAVASGGTEAGSDIDFATPWLKFFLGFIGITDVTVITADQLGADADSKIERAYGEIDTLAA